MYYKATDKWNNGDNLEHRSHKYYMKVGTGPNTRYFYSAQEYQAWTRGGRQPQKTGSSLAKMGSGLMNRFKKARNEAAAKQLRKQQDADLARVRAQQSENIRAAEERKAKITASRDKARKNAVQRATGKESRQVDFLKAKNDAKTRSQRLEAAYKKKTAATAESQRMKDPSYARKKKAKQFLGKAAKTAKRAFNASKKAAKTGYQNAAIAYTSPKGNAIRKKVKNTANKTYKITKKKSATTAKKAYNSGRKFVKNLFKKRK